MSVCPVCPKPHHWADGLNEEIDIVAELRRRLVVMRAELVESMARDQIDAGTLALLAGVAAAIDATEAAGDAPASAITALRAVLADDDKAITLTLYGEAGDVAAVTVAPQRAVALAGELIAAALPRLATP